MPLSWYVLCITSDGQIEFEAVINGRCVDNQATSWTQSEIAFTALAASVDRFDSCFFNLCLDIPISASNGDQQAVVPAKSKSPDLSVSTTALTAIQPITTIVDPTNNPLLDDPPRIHPTLISLRTVTLLI